MSHFVALLVGWVLGIFTPHAVLRQNTIRGSTATQQFAMGLIQKSTSSCS